LAQLRYEFPTRVDIVKPFVTLGIGQYSLKEETSRGFTISHDVESLGGGVRVNVAPRVSLDFSLRTLVDGEGASMTFGAGVTFAVGRLK
jgi:hypothetical protein